MENDDFTYAVYFKGQETADLNHYSFEEAKIEACRLAGLNVGKMIYGLRLLFLSPTEVSRFGEVGITVIKPNNGKGE